MSTTTKNTPKAIIRSKDVNPKDYVFSQVITNKTHKSRSMMIDYKNPGTKGVIQTSNIILGPFPVDAYVKQGEEGSMPSYSLRIPLETDSELFNTISAIENRLIEHVKKNAKEVFPNKNYSDDTIKEIFKSNIKSWQTKENRERNTDVHVTELRCRLDNWNNQWGFKTYTPESNTNSVDFNTVKDKLAGAKVVLQIYPKSCYLLGNFGITWIVNSIRIKDMIEVCAEDDNPFLADSDDEDDEIVKTVPVQQVSDDEGSDGEEHAEPEEDEDEDEDIVPEPVPEPKKGAKKATTSKKATK